MNLAGTSIGDVAQASQPVQRHVPFDWRPFTFLCRMLIAAAEDQLHPGPLIQHAALLGSY
jgi:hypothetical protein